MDLFVNLYEKDGNIDFSTSAYVCITAKNYFIFVATFDKDFSESRQHTFF